MSGFLRRFRRSQAAGGSLPPVRATGERVIPEESGEGFNRVNLVRHRVAHLHAIGRIAGSRRVLDVGCGTGYGCAVVAPHVGEVAGIDLSGEAVARAKAANRLDNVRFATMPATALDFPDGSFDAAYSVQVIEPIDDVKLHLSEVIRILRPGERYVVATPNRLTYSPNGLHNAFHLRVYDARELEALLAPYFAEVEVTGLHAGLDLALRPEVRDYAFSARVKALRDGRAAARRHRPSGRLSGRQTFSANRAAVSPPSTRNLLWKSSTVLPQFRTSARNRLRPPSA